MAIEVVEEAKLNNILKEEEILWRQRSRVHWLKEGDANTSHFHKTANGRGRTNSYCVYSAKRQYT